MRAETTRDHSSRGGTQGRRNLETSHKKMQPPISCKTLSPRSNLLGTQRANNLPALQEPVPSVVRCLCSGTFAKCSVVQFVNLCWTLTPRTGRFTEDANKQTNDCLLRERRNVCEQFIGKQCSRRTTAVRTDVLTFPPKQRNAKKTACIAAESPKDDAVCAYWCRLIGTPTASSRTDKSASPYAVVLWLLWVRLRCITPTTPSAASSLPLQREGRPEDSYLQVVMFARANHRSFAWTRHQRLDVWCLDNTLPLQRSLEPEDAVSQCWCGWESAKTCSILFPQIERRIDHTFWMCACVSNFVRIKRRCGVTKDSDVTRCLRLATSLPWTVEMNPMRLSLAQPAARVRSIWQLCEIVLGSTGPPARCPCSIDLTTVWDCPWLDGTTSPLPVFDRC